MFMVRRWDRRAGDWISRMIRGSALSSVERNNKQCLGVCMKVVLRIVVSHLSVLVILNFSGAQLSAQWDPYPQPGAPKNPDGSVNITAPTPRTAQGTPDLSGVWLTVRDKPLGENGVQNTRSSFFNIGMALKDGLPLTPYGAEIRKNRLAENSQGDPDAHCLPMNLVHLHFGSDPRKIVQTPGLIVFLFETNSQVRQVFTDGRSIPKDPQPWWYGYSVGSWQGDTLVIKTTHFRDGGWLDAEGSPLTDAATVTERIRRVNYGNLEIEMTVDDPKAYTKPWTVQVKQRLLLADDLIEYICLENEKDAAHYVAR